MDEQAKKLAESVLAWWDEHRYDSCRTGDGDWDNVFDRTPDFVILAAKMTGRDEATL